MKKTLLFASVAFIAMTTASAQTTLIDENFDSLVNLEEWYSLDADGDTFTWGIYTDGTPGQEDYGIIGGFAASASWEPEEGPLTPDNLLITQEFTIPAGATSDLTYHVSGLDPDYFAEHYAVYVVNAETANPIIFDIIDEVAEPGTLLDLLTTPLVEETLAEADRVEKTASLTDFAGQTVRLIFRHYDVTNEYILILDDVLVTATELNVSDFVSSQVAVYPNPVKGILNISANASVSPKEVRISDLNGRVIQTQEISGLESQLSTTNLSSGIYAVEIVTDKGTAVKKIVKE